MFYYRTKCTLTVWSNNHTLWYLCTTLKTYIPILIFIAVLFMTAKTWKQLKCPSVRWMVNSTVEYPNNVTLFTTKKKKISYQAMEIYERVLNVFICCWVKKANLKCLHIVWFQLCIILENEKQIMNTMKSSVVTKSDFGREQGGKKDRQNIKHFWGQWKCSVWYYNDGYKSLYIFPTPTVVP